MSEDAFFSAVMDMLSWNLKNITVDDKKSLSKYYKIIISPNISNICRTEFGKRYLENVCKIA